MFSFFNYEKLSENIAEKWSQFQEEKPFKHLVIDGAADEEKLSQCLARFPRPEDLAWWKYDNVFEKKLAFDKVHLLPDPIKQILIEFNSMQMVEFLEKVTGITGLIPDPFYAGGGLHQIQRGGKLDVHADFNILTRCKLDRRLNVIIYLNKNWDESYGGALELWDKEMKACQKKVYPIFNRLVIFETTDFSYHGHPDPLECPEGMTRKSLALYYYTNGRPENEKRPQHSTLYQKRPEDVTTEEIEALREKRAKGRIQDATT